MELKKGHRLNLTSWLNLSICNQLYYWTENSCRAYLMSDPRGVRQNEQPIIVPTLRNFPSAFVMNLILKNDRGIWNFTII